MIYRAPYEPPWLPNFRSGHIAMALSSGGEAEEEASPSGGRTYASMKSDLAASANLFSFLCSLLTASDVHMLNAMSLPNQPLLTVN